jgi:tripartite-type tricarboxylate transporter receptor subunit TctC
VDGVCDAATSVAPSIQTGKVRGLTVAARRNLEILPDVPTSTEAGLPEFMAEGWNAIFTPAGWSPPSNDTGWAGDLPADGRRARH